MTYASIAHNVRDPHNLKSRYGADSWVVVSGATDPLGQEFAKRFRNQGFNLVLVDSDQQQLDAAKQMLSEIKGDNKSIETFSFDFKNDADWKSYQSLCEKIQDGRNVSVLINNVEEMEKFG